MANPPSDGGYRAAGAAAGPFRRQWWLQSAVVAGLAAVRAICIRIRSGGMEGLVVSVAAPSVRSGLASAAGGGCHLFHQRWSV